MSPYNEKAYSEENLLTNLAEIPLPGPALVIDVRTNTAHALSLVWDVAKEIEDLTIELDINRVPRWRFLAHCIDMLRISSLPPRTSLDTAPYFEIMTEEDKVQTISQKQALANLVFERIDNLRIKHARAIQDRIGGRHTEETLDPAHTAVRIFFLVDLKNEASLSSATSFAKLLNLKDKDYDDPERTGRMRGLKIFAICINADPTYRKREFATQRIATQNPRSIFDMLIFIQSYRDDNTPIRSDVLIDEMELILYTLLLVSPKQLDTEQFEEQDVARYMMKIQGHDIPPAPCPIYMLGIASTEYSGRWSSRWINYNLVGKIIEILQDQANIEQERHLLQHKNKDWLNEWWSQLQTLSIPALSALLPELQILNMFEQQLNGDPFRIRSSQSTNSAALDIYCRQVITHYKQMEQTLQSLLEEETHPFVHIVQNILAEYGIENTSSNDKTDALIIDLYSQAECFLVTLFQKAAGAIPRAARQLSQLETLLTEREKLAQFPDITKFRQQFETEAKTVQQQLKGDLQARSLPFPFLGKQNKQRIQMQEETLKKLRLLAKSHLVHLHTTFTAQLGLTLLEQAGLYSHDGRISPQRQRVRELDLALDSVREQTATQLKKAERGLHTIQGLIQDIESEGISSRREILPFQYIMQSYHDLKAQFTSQNAGYLKELSISILSKLAIRSSNHCSASHMPKQNDKQGQLQMLGTELVAAMLLASTTDYDITNVQPIMNRYLDFSVGSTPEQTDLTESIATLQQIVKEAILAQTLREQEDLTYQSRPLYGFLFKHYQSVEDILAAWIELQYVPNKELKHLLNPISIVARLKEQHRSLDYELEDLQRRGELLGYREQTQSVENDHFYLLFLPGPNANELAQVLNSMRAVHLESIHFPDREKMIYLHVHRIHSGFPSAYSSSDI